MRVWLPRANGFCHNQLTARPEQENIHRLFKIERPMSLVFGRHFEMTMRIKLLHKLLGINNRHYSGAHISVCKPQLCGQQKHVQQCL